MISVVVATLHKAGNATEVGRHERCRSSSGWIGDAHLICSLLSSGLTARAALPPSLPSTQHRRNMESLIRDTDWLAPGAAQHR